MLWNGGSRTKRPSDKQTSRQTSVGFEAQAQCVCVGMTGCHVFNCKLCTCPPHLRGGRLRGVVLVLPGAVAASPTACGCYPHCLLGEAMTCTCVEKDMEEVKRRLSGSFCLLWPSRSAETGSATDRRTHQRSPSRRYVRLHIGGWLLLSRNPTGVQGLLYSCGMICMFGIRRPCPPILL